MSTEKKTVSFSIDLLNAITGYLGTKPFQEVYPLITKIQEEASESFKVPEVPTEKTAKKE